MHCEEILLILGLQGVFMTNICLEKQFWIQITWIYRLLELESFF